MTDVLKVELRDELGSLATRRLRRSGKVPAVLYGHGEENKHLAIASGDVTTLLRHHSRTVSLAGADRTSPVPLREENSSYLDEARSYFLALLAALVRATASVVVRRAETCAGDFGPHSITQALQAYV